MDGGISTLFTIFSGISQVFSSFSSGASQQSAYDAQAAANNYNAAVSRNNAIMAQNAAQADADAQKRRNLAQEAKLSAGILKSGVLMEGTPLLLVADNAGQNELERQRILYKGQVQAQNFNDQAGLSDYNASVARSAGETANSGSQMQGIFSGISKVGSALFTNE